MFYGGEIKGESAVEYENEIGSSVVHSYEVTCKHRLLSLEYVYFSILYY